ncbi:MAG: circularly permuted type 2 ATP-grasp protein, partial [Actinomycetes bacterium]
MSGDFFTGSPDCPADEAVSPDGRPREPYRRLAPTLERLGAFALAYAAGRMAAERRDRGVAVSTWADGRQHVRPLPLDPIPRI